MIDNVAGDEVEPKPTKNEAFGDGSGDVKPTSNVNTMRQLSHAVFCTCAS